MEEKSWMKPHLRNRLAEEQKARKPKTADGLTDINQGSSKSARLPENFVIELVIELAEMLELTPEYIRACFSNRALRKLNNVGGVALHKHRGTVIQSQTSVRLEPMLKTCVGTPILSLNMIYGESKLTEPTFSDWYLIMDPQESIVETLRVAQDENNL